MEFEEDSSDWFSEEIISLTETEEAGVSSLLKREETALSSGLEGSSLALEKEELRAQEHKTAKEKIAKSCLLIMLLFYAFPSN